jgi:hypothetical protein
MARSRPKLSQSPWSGLDAVRKIMDRFGEFGESLNRMAGALHGLEDSMKHLLGVTSRVTAAMLMLHGSLAYTGKPKQEFKSTNDKDKPDEKNWEQIIKAGDDRRKKRDEEEKEKARRLKLERDFNNKLYKLNTEKDRLSKLANKYEDMSKTSKTYFMGQKRQEFIKERKKFISIYESKKVNAKALDDNDEAKQSFEDTKTKQTKAEKAAATKSGGVPKGPADTTIKKWVLDTEYGFASLEKDPEKAVKEHGQLDKKDQQQKRIVTQISLIGVNELGQIIKSFSQNIEPVLNSGETLYNLGNKTDQEHKNWTAQQGKVKNKVSLDEAAVNLASFSAAEKVHESIHNPDIDAPKLVGKNALSADIAALTNSINKVVGNVLFDKDLPTQNTNEATLDPVTANAKDIKRLLSGLNTDELKKIGDSFGLDNAKLLDLAQTPDKGLKQTDLVSLFKQTYTGAGAHDAESDTKAYAKLDPIIQKFVQILKASIDTRSRDEALDQANLGQNAELDLARRSELEFEAEPLAIEKNQVVSDVAARIKDIDIEASDIALAQNNTAPTSTSATGSPDGPRAYLSSFSMNPDKSWKEQPHLLVDGQDILSPNSTPNATPEDYIAKLKELKAANAKSTMGRKTDFNEAIDALSNASKITPLDPNMTYKGFNPAPLKPLAANPKSFTETSDPHVSRVHVSPFETTGTGAFTTKPKMDIDRLPAMTGTYADDTAYTEEMVSKLDELIAADATNMQGSSDALKSIRDILKNVLDEFKNYKGILAPIPQGVPISSTSTITGPPPPPTPPPIPFLPKSLKDVGAQIKDFGSRLAKIGPALMNKLKEVDFTKVMGGGMENAKEAFSTLAKGIFVTATALSGAVMGLSQLASADVFATFQNSLVLLGMTVGSAFKEPMLKLSWYIQQLAGQFENMSPAVRETLTSLAEWSMYIVGASMALKAFVFIASPIAMVVKGLWSFVVALGAAVAAMGKQGIGTAIGNGIAGLMGGGAKDAMGLGGSWMGPALTNTLKFAGVVAKTTVVVGLAYEAFAGLIDIMFKTNLSMTKNLGNYFAKKEEEKTERALNDSDKRPETEKDKARALKNFDENKEYAKQQIDSSPELANLFNERIQKGYAKASVWDEKLNKGDHPMHSMLNHPALHGVSHSEKENYAKSYNQAEQQYHKAKKEGNEKGMDINRMEMANILNNTWRAGQAKVGTPDKPDEHVDRLRDYASGQQMQQGFANQNKTTKASKGESEKDKAKKDFESGGGMKGLLMSLQSFRSQPSYMGVEEAHRRVQVEALKSDPLEQKINEIRSKELADMIRLLGKIEEGQPKKSPILEYTESILRGGH